MELDASMEAGILGWVATHPEGAAGLGHGRPLIEVLADELGLEPNPDTLDRLADAFADSRAGGTHRPGRRGRRGARGRPARPCPPTPGRRVRRPCHPAAAGAALHRPCRCALARAAELGDPAARRADRPRLRTGRDRPSHTVTELGLNPKDVRHDLEALGLLRRVGPTGRARRCGGWTPTPPSRRRPWRSCGRPLPRRPRRPRNPGCTAPARTQMPDLGPIVDSLTRLEPRLSQLIKELVDAAESLNRMALSQGQLLREMTQEIEALRQDRETLMREVAELRRGNWTARTSPAASLRQRSCQRKPRRCGRRRPSSPGPGTEISDKMRRVGRSLRDVQAGEAAMTALGSGPPARRLSSARLRRRPCPPAPTRLVRRPGPPRRADRPPRPTRAVRRAQHRVRPAEEEVPARPDRHRPDRGQPLDDPGGQPGSTCRRVRSQCSRGASTAASNVKPRSSRLVRTHVSALRIRSLPPLPSASSPPHP